MTNDSDILKRWQQRLQGLLLYQRGGRASPGYLVTIPSTALVTGNQGTQVATLDSNDKVVLKNVRLGRDFGDSVEVIAGLSPSDRIINNPPETLAAGDTVRVAAAAAQAAGPVSSSSTSRQ